MRSQAGPGGARVGFRASRTSSLRTSLLRRAYAGILERQVIVTDEVSVVESLGISTKLIESGFPNPKITVPADIHPATALMR